MTASSILFVVNAGPTVGGGHVMRSLTLATALEARGARCSFLAPPAVGTILASFAPEAAQWPAASTEPRDLAGAAGAAAFDAVVFDHYGLAEPDHKSIGKARPALAIANLAD